MASKRAFGGIIKRGPRYLIRFRWGARRIDRGSWTTKTQAATVLRRLEDCHADGVSLSVALERCLGEGRALAPTWEIACDAALTEALKRCQSRRHRDTRAMYALIRRAPFKRAPIDEIQRRDVKTYLRGMRVSGATKNKRLSACRMVFAWAMELDYVEHDPTHGIRREQEPPPRETRLSRTQARRFLELAQDKGVVKTGDTQAFHAALMLALYGGFRRSNFLGFRWSWRFAGAVHIPKGLAKQDERIVVREAPPLAAALDSLRETQGDDADYVFPARRKTRTGHVSDQWFRRRFHRVLTALRSEDPSTPPDLRVHDLRTTFASILREQGATMEEISEVMGHRDSRVTEARYAFLNDDQKGHAAARIAI